MGGGGEQIEADDSFTITQLKRSERVMGACRVCCVPHFTAVVFFLFLTCTLDFWPRGKN